MKKTLFIALPALLLGFAAQAQTITAFNPGDNSNLGDVANWSAGLPLTAQNRQGTIATNATLDLNPVSGWNVVQTAGTVTLPGNRQINEQTTWNLQGGAIIVSGATAQWNTTANNGYTFNMSGGTFTAHRMNAYDGTVLNLSGGTITVDRAIFQGVQLTFLAGDASIVANTELVTSATTVINFVSSSGGTLTATNLGLVDYEALWNSERLRFDGGNVGAFSDHFTVTGNTLAVIPEPSTYAAIFGLMVLGLAAWRRRKA
ncbi:MAG: PEP-CTERM sorting domain-containing protein [Opitutales bacterium]|nr:PEP-CTERM sorting domain-containing protein [Opitutales bacterium]